MGQRTGRVRTRRGRGDRGAAAVETALCICFVVVPLVFAVVAYAWMLSFRQTLSQAAAEGARAAAVLQVTGDASARQAAQTGAAQAAIKAAMETSPQPMECGSEHLTCQITFPSCPSIGSGTCVRVEVSYPYRAHPLLPTVPGLGFTLPASIGYAAEAGVS